ncbi:hypothetical protein E4U54_002425 [Claviceps lovelessii]|nr:hypothetical protein E4U54_002425 [Claviceps lovelessii]
MYVARMDWQQESTNVSEELRVKEYGKDWTLDNRTRDSRIETSGFWTSSVPHQENTRAGSHALLRSCPTKVRVGINDLNRLASRSSYEREYYYRVVEEDDPSLSRQRTGTASAHVATKHLRDGGYCTAAPLLFCAIQEPQQRISSHLRSQSIIAMKQDNIEKRGGLHHQSLVVQTVLFKTQCPF